MSDPGGYDHEDDDLDGYLTPMRRFVERVKGPLGFLIALLLVVPAATGLVRWLVFDRASDRVVEELDAQDLDRALVDSVLLVGAAPCTGGGTATGTAFVMQVDGSPVLLTNRHVVADVGEVGLQRLGGGSGPVVDSWRLSSSADVAVLTLRDPDAAPPALPVATAGAEVGQRVRTVGFPSGMPFTTAGDVTAVGGGELRLDMQVDPGASGSPVLDRTGAVVGQVFARTAEGRGVATRVGTVVAALDDLGEARSGCGS